MVYTKVPKQLTQFLRFYTISASSKLKSPQKGNFYLLNQKKYSTFAPAIPRWGCLHINWRREADIIKGVYWRLFWWFEILQNFTYPKQESGKCPLVCIFRCALQRLAYRRGHSLFILVCRVLQEPRTEE